MSALVPTVCRAQEANNLHGVFLAVLPRLEQHAQISFRHIRCQATQQDAIAETIALSWKWFVRLTEKGKEPEHFASAIATFAVRAVRSGRRLCGQEKPKDVLSSIAQRRHGFAATSLPSNPRRSHKDLYSDPCGQHKQDVFEERLRDNTQTPPDEQAAFRIDFPIWLATYADRQRRIIRDLMAGERTLDVASRHSISPARVSQMRRAFEQDWLCFLGESDSSSTTASRAAV